MSNSIWKTPDQKPEKENHIVLVGAWASCLWYGGEKPEEIFWENVKRWAYLEDIITQADKAERLERAVQYLKRLHIATIEKYNPKEKELAEQTIDYAIEMAIEQESNN